MKHPSHALPTPAGLTVEVDGVYFRVSERLGPMICLLASGCSASELRCQVDTLKPGQIYDVVQLRYLIDSLILPHGLRVDEAALSSSAIWRLRAVRLCLSVSTSESAIRCRVTIVPERLANNVAQTLKFLYAPAGIFAAISLFLFAMGRYLSRFGVGSLSIALLFRSIRTASTSSVIATIAAILFTSLLHEVGHCTAVAAFGSRVRRIGLGIYWLSPALFSDVSAAWTLTRWQRVAVDCGGIYFQALTCSVYALAATVTRSTSLQTSLRIAIVANVVAIVSSLNPIMKCDGYWIVSDAMSIPNLRRQSEREMREFARALFKKSRTWARNGTRQRGFLLCYGSLSFLFSAAMFLLFVSVIERNAAYAIYFPAELWHLLWMDPRSGHVGAQCARLALDLLKVVPIVCAPMAVATAASACMGFVSRTISNAD